MINNFACTYTYIHIYFTCSPDGSPSLVWQCGEELGTQSTCPLQWSPGHRPSAQIWGRQRTAEEREVSWTCHAETQQYSWSWCGRWETYWWMMSRHSWQILDETWLYHPEWTTLGVCKGQDSIITVYSLLQTYNWRSEKHIRVTIFNKWLIYHSKNMLLKNLTTLLFIPFNYAIIFIDVFNCCGVLQSISGWPVWSSLLNLGHIGIEACTEHRLHQFHVVWVVVDLWVEGVRRVDESTVIQQTRKLLLHVPQQLWESRVGEFAMWQINKTICL